jgi:phage terminase large subunit
MTVKTGQSAIERYTPQERQLIRATLVDPCGFVKTWLLTDLWNTQNDILTALAKPHAKVAVKACHSSGKTFLAALALLWWLARYQSCVIVTTAPTLNQVKKLLWGEVHSALARSKYPFPKAQLTELKMGEKRYAIGFTTSVTKQDEGVKFQGFHADHILVILDEAPGIDPKIYEAIEGARAGGIVHVLALGNPTVPSGVFFDAFGADADEWTRFTISAFDTPNLDGCCLNYEETDEVTQEVKKKRLGNGERDLMTMTEEELDTNVMPWLTTRRWVRDRFKRWGVNNPRFQARVLGQFPKQSDDSLLSLTWLERAQNDDRAFPDEPIRAGLDVAGPGEDETVLTLRRGPQIILQVSWPDADPRGQVVAVLNQYREHLDVVNVDSIGIGYGMYLHLQDQGFPAYPLNVAAETRFPEKFVNLKAELYWGLRQRAQDGDLCGLDDDTTLSQLAGIRYKHNSRGQILIESKEDARKRGVKSPDRAESTMLAFAEPGGNWTGLLRFYQASAAAQAKEQPKPQQPLPKAEGVRPAPPPPAPPKLGPVKAYERAIASMTPQRLCSKCKLVIKETDSVTSDGFEEWHSECNKPSWAW